tara:strand:+ start:183 stop:1022 length:840 start_codon:yes stop_codon:yes gene_type:complete
MKKIVFFNNKYINSKNAFISYEDRGFQFADSIYEVIAFINNNFIDLDFHLRRLRRSLKLIDIKYSFNKKNLQKIFKKLIKINKNKKGLIYLQISRGVQPRNHSYNKNLKPTIIIYTIKKNLNENLDKLSGKKAITYPDLRWKRRDIKSVSLLPNVLAAKAASKKSAYEAILIDNDVVTEGTASNIWIVKKNKLITHPANTDILKGITRQSIVKIIKKEKLVLSEKKIKKSELFIADEVFLTSSSSFVTPIVKIDNKLINKGRIGKITYNLAKIYNSKFQ